MKNVFRYLAAIACTTMAMSAMAALSERGSVPITQNVKPGTQASGDTSREARRAAALADCLKKGDQPRFYAACINSMQLPRLSRKACEEKSWKQNDAYCRSYYK